MLLSRESFDQLLRDFRVKALPVDGLKSAKLIVDPLNSRLRLNLVTNDIPDLALEENLTWESLRILEPGSIEGELTILASGQMFEAYLLVADIVSEFIELGSLRVALDSVTERFSELLSKSKILSAEKQLGLLGELLVVRELAKITLGDPTGFWLGPEREEHDFKLPEIDIEVKTTASERRQHTIGSLSQLMASQGRPLYLISIQLTRASAGSGFSLSETIDELNALGSISSPSLEQKLERYGWRKEHHHLYRVRFETRFDPMVYLVNESFPRLTAASLDMPEGTAARISDISYRLDLEGLTPCEDIGDILRGGLSA